MADFVCPDKNLEPLKPTGFQLIIDKLPDMSIWSQEVTIPGIALPSAEEKTPFINLSEAGDFLEFENLEVKFLVDSKMDNYKQIFYWLFGLGFPSSYTDFTDFLRNQSSLSSDDRAKTLSDATMLVYGNDEKVIQRVRFVDVHPVSISGLTFITNAEDVVYLHADAVFDYKYFYFE